MTAPDRPFGTRPIPIEAWAPLGIDRLEPAAWDALQHGGNSSVSAGPGAGKTEFLAQRAAYLLQTELCAEPSRVLAISFKRDSAANLARRVKRRIPEHAHRFDSMTFDSFTKGLLDRFPDTLPEFWRSKASNYRLQYAKNWEARSFLEQIASRLQEPHRSKVLELPYKKFLASVLGAQSLPKDFSAGPKGAEQYAAWKWWEQRYLSPSEAFIDFTMINRLAELIIRSNPALARALRATYRYVFVDEFQDTTAAQLNLLQTAFQHERVTTTVVGDDKQRIMEFAGAVSDAMELFDREFAAEHFDLLWNFRSSAELVQAQHGVALRLNAATVPTISQAADEPGHVPLSLWSFNDEHSQAETIAKWISEDCATSDRTASDFVLLSRSKIGDFEGALRPAFDRQNLGLRNDAREYEDIPLQSLLAHDLTDFATGLLRLALQPTGLPELWLETQAKLKRLRGEPRSDVAARRLADDLHRWIRELRKWLDEAPPASRTAHQTLVQALGVVTVAQLEAYVTATNPGDSFDDVLRAIVLRLDEAMLGASTEWTIALDHFLAEDAVSMMTIHRSKGLEYHSVIVLGLDRSTWFGMRDDPQGETASFFVGLSRAARRVIFTTIDQTAPDGELRPFYELLDEVGSVRTSWSD